MSFEPNREDTCYVLSLSYGKDSIACIEACKQLGWRIDRIVHAEVWATDDISADLPPMVEFKKYADKVIKERYGLDVEHICAMCTPDKKVNFQKPLKVMGYTNAPTKTSFTERERTNNTERSGTDSLAQEELGVTVNSKSKCCKLTYQDIFYRPLSPRSKMIQKAIERERERIYGFPMRGVHWCTGELKQSAIRISKSMDTMVYGGTQKFSPKHQKRGADINIVSYLGIAADEPERIARHSVKKDILLPLVEIGWDEKYCRQWCEENDLLSPIYTDSARGGCWFCHNQGVDQLRKLRRNYPDLWELLLKWDNDSPVTFKSDGHTVHDYDKRFEYEEIYNIPTDKKFRWKMLEEDLQFKFKEK